MSKIAILISTYNGEKYIKCQIESIINQDLEEDFDIIVRDDGSKDNTIAILNDYFKQGKIRLIKGSNLGAAKSFLWLLQNNTNYDYYAFSDQDDIWYPNKIQEGINRIKKYSGPTLYFSNANLVNENNESLKRLVHRGRPFISKESILCISTVAQGCTTIINSDLAKYIQQKSIPENIIMHDTYITSLCSLINGNIIFDENPYMDYKIHSDNDVGMPTKEQIGLIGMAKLRISDIFTRRKISMSDQAKTLYDLYKDEFDNESKKICMTVIRAKDSFFDRIKLVFSKKLRYESISMYITYKIKILLGNN